MRKGDLLRIKMAAEKMEKLEQAKINEAYHRKQMEYFQEQIKILKQ